MIRNVLAPMAMTEIRESAALYAPKIQLRDVSVILNALSIRNLVVCLTPEQVNGKVIVLTCAGREVVKKMFDVEVRVPPSDIDWPSVSWIMRGRAHRAVLMELGGSILTPTEVKKALIGKSPMDLNTVQRELKDVVRQGLAERVERDGARHGAYRLNEAGDRIWRMLLEKARILTLARRSVL